MPELPLMFLGGLLGSAHCVGMCGAIAISVGAGATSWKNHLLRQIVYSSGRIVTYTLLGAIAAYLGGVLQLRLNQFAPVQAILSVIAGVLLAIQGLLAIGWWPRKSKPQSQTGCLVAKPLATLLTGPGWTDKFLAGVLNGLLPCGLVYAFLALAATRGNMLSGALTMTAFGLGTMPVLAAVGYLGTLISLSWRVYALRFAAACVLVTGLLSVARGVESWNTQRNTGNAGCPYCQKK